MNQTCTHRSLRRASRRCVASARHILKWLLFAGLAVLLRPGDAAAYGITFSWDSMHEEVGDARPTGYRIYYDIESWDQPMDGTGANEGDSPIDLPIDSLEVLPPEPPWPASVQFRITGLPSCRSMHFVVTAYNDAGESQFLGESNYLSGTFVHRPNVLALPADDGAVTLHWQGPSAADIANGAELDGGFHYRVFYEAQSHPSFPWDLSGYVGTGAVVAELSGTYDSPFSITPANPADDMVVHLSGLNVDSGTEYFFRVSGQCYSGSCDLTRFEGCWASSERSATTTACSVADDCDDDKYCNGAETCNAPACEPGTPPCESGADDLHCTDTCVEGDDGALCNELQYGTCAIGGACWRTSHRKSDNQCQACLPNLADDDWSTLGDSSPCDDGDSCTDPDTCQIGVCTPGPDICVDAGEPDAAEPDAAEMDAAEPDSAEADAAGTDAAEPDAAAPDAGPSDAAAPDLIESDAAAGDAASIDAAAEDAPQPDAIAEDRPTADTAHGDLGPTDQVQVDAGGGGDLASRDTALDDLAQPDTSMTDTAGADLAAPDIGSAAPDSSGADLEGVDRSGITGADAAADEIEETITISDGCGCATRSDRGAWIWLGVAAAVVGGRLRRRRSTR